MVALCSFAANSVLCRLALRGHEIDAAFFTWIRIASGAIMLALVHLATQRSWKLPKGGSWFSGLMLAIYAAGFSYAYLSLSIGTGALILFGAVQITILGWGAFHGDRPNLIQALGILLAAGGLVYLVLPGVEAPTPIGASLMGSAGIAWGIYTIRGKSEKNASAATTNNFLFAFGLLIWLLPHRLLYGHASPIGIGYAIASGAITSGLGYIAWYAALPNLSATRAAVVQLLVPIMAGFAGATLVSEPIPTRLLFAGAMTLGGIAIVVFGKRSSSLP